MFRPPSTAVIVGCFLGEFGDISATARPVTSPPFSYDKVRGFLMNRIAPETPESLERFCKRKEHYQSKQWVTTQMELFGVPFQESSSTVVLIQDLKAAFRAPQGLYPLPRPP